MLYRYLTNSTISHIGSQVRRGRWDDGWAEVVLGRGLAGRPGAAGGSGAQSVRIGRVCNMFVCLQVCSIYIVVMIMRRSKNALYKFIYICKHIHFYTDTTSAA